MSKELYCRGKTKVSLLGEREGKRQRERTHQIDGKEVLVSIVVPLHSFVILGMREDLLHLSLLLCSAEQPPPRDFGHHRLESSRESPPAPLALVADQWLVTFVHLPPVGWLSLAQAETGVVARQSREEGEHAMALLESR